MPIIKFFGCIPEELVEKASYSDLLETIRSTDKFDEYAARVLDFIYRMRLICCILFQDLGYCRELNNHLARVLHPKHKEKLSDISDEHCCHESINYYERWKGYTATLESIISILVDKPLIEELRRQRQKEREGLEKE